MAFSPVPVSDIELSKLKNNPSFAELYTEAKNNLVKCGFINFLRIFGRPFTRDMGANPYTSAYLAAFTEGYNKCLDDIVYFDEQYLNEVRGKKAVTANFGALGIALAKGDLTKKDLEHGK